MDAYDSEPSPEQMQRLAGKILADDQFRNQFFNDPQAMAQEFDPTITLTEDQIQTIGSLDKVEINGYVQQIIGKIGSDQFYHWLVPPQQEVL
jgi:hypothetical protein